MKHSKILLLLIISLFLPSAYADGGFFWAVARKTEACPPGQSGRINYICQYSSNVGIQFCNKQNGWKVESKTCQTDRPVYQSTKTESKSLSCPATQPSGTWTQSRTYELWSDGSKKNYSSWRDVKKTCAAVKQSTQTENKNVACAVGETGSIQQKQTYEVWSDATKRNYSGWVNVSSTCKPIPSETIETKDGVQEESCDSYYGVAQGTYSGTVYKHGTYTTTYSATVKATDTKFQFEITNVDYESCVAQITDVIQETNELACPSGQTGSIQHYRVKATNSQGLEIFPYGEQWIVSNNNCASTQTDTQPIANAGAAPDGLLSNISVTSSSLQNGEAFSNYLNSLSASNWATSERHKLIVTIDDLSSGKYSASKVGAIISKFQSVVGAGNSDIEIALPRTIDKYTGNGDITAKAVKDKTVMMKDVSFEGGDVILTYMQLSKKTIEKPQSKEIVINVIPKNLSFKGIFAN